MLKARDIMNPEPSFCQLDTPLKEVSRRFSEESMSGVLVVDDEQYLLGVITEGDLIDQQAKLHLPTAIALFDMVIPLGEEKFEHELARMQAVVAKDLMVTDVQTVDVDDDLSQVAALMSESHVHHLPVLEDNIVVGVINRHAVIQALAGHLFAE